MEVSPAQRRETWGPKAEIPPPVSTVKVDYVFQMQLLESDEDVDGYLPGLERRLGESLAADLRSVTDDGTDATQCGGITSRTFDGGWTASRG